MNRMKPDEESCESGHPVKGSSVFAFAPGAARTLCVVPLSPKALAVLQLLLPANVNASSRR